MIGLRLFPNPKFDKKARAKWDAKRYYTDPRITTPTPSSSGPSGLG